MRHKPSVKWRGWSAHQGMGCRWDTLEEQSNTMVVRWKVPPKLPAACKAYSRQKKAAVGPCGYTHPL